MAELCNAPDILNPHVRAVANPNKFEGVGVSEAPRGTLFHHYKIDEQGLITWANLIVATGNNNLAMNKGIAQAARHFVNGKDDQGGRAEPRGGGHPLLRSLPELLHPRPGPDAHSPGPVVNAKGETVRER
jgi:hypothetical protein